MLKVLRLSNEEYWVITARDCQVGNLVRTVDNMAKLGIDDKEIENGLVSLQLNDHQVAEYGIHGIFIFSARLAG